MGREKYNLYVVVMLDCVTFSTPLILPNLSASEEICLSAILWRFKWNNIKEKCNSSLRTIMLCVTENYHI